jgi:hypothetical protein
VEVARLRLQCLGEVKNANIPRPDLYWPAFDLSGIAALRVKLDEVMIDAAAGDGEWRTTKLLSICRHTPKDERPEMIAVDFNFESIECSKIGQRHIEQRRGYASP